MLREKPSITPPANYMVARERPTCSSTSLPTTNSAATMFFRLLGFSISSRTPTSPAHWKTTSGIWRNTVCELVSPQTYLRRQQTPNNMKKPQLTENAVKNHEELFPNCSGGP